MTEARAPGGKLAPRLDLTGAEWKLVIVTWLAAVYSASWLAVQPEGGAIADGPAPVGPTARPAAAQARPSPARSRSTRIRTRSS